MDKERFEILCSAYVLNTLDEEESKEFEEALKHADSEMKKFYNEMVFTASHLPLNVSTKEPPLKVKQKILNALQPQYVEKKSILTKLATIFGLHKPRAAFAVSFALLVIAIGLSYYNYHFKQTIHHQQNQITALKDELIQKEELLKILEAPKIELVFMDGLEINPAGYGKIIWDPDNKIAILQISNLPSVPEDKDYQLWIIKDNKPISAGVFAVNNPQKEIFFKIEQLAETNKQLINAFAVTLEPKGGLPQPSGQMYLLGSPSL